MVGDDSEAKPKKINAKFFTVDSDAKADKAFIIDDKQNGLLMYDADGSCAKTAVLVSKLSKDLRMTHRDVFVV